MSENLEKVRENEKRIMCCEGRKKVVRDEKRDF